MGLPVRPFNITVVLTASSETGGGFHQSLTSLRMVALNAPEHFRIQVLDVQGTFSDEIDQLVSDGTLNRANILPASFELRTLNDRVAASSRWLYRIARILLGLWGTKVGMSAAARYLDNSESDLVYFVSPSPMAIELQQKPFVWTLWDIAHLDTPEFPEVRTSGKFENREAFISTALRKSALTVLDSRTLLSNVRTAYGIHTDKFVTIPFIPPAQVSDSPPSSSGLPEGIDELTCPYFFYPAQLWAHKNHVRIAQAVAILKAKGVEVHAVFVGKDHGSGPAIRRAVKKLGVSDQIHFLGYVEGSMIPQLYQQSAGLVMASYFGPTNIPPLEAFVLKTPVVASNLHKEQLGNAALYFDPDDAEDLASKMLEIRQSKVRTDLTNNGIQRLQEIYSDAKTGNAELIKKFQLLSRRIIR